MAAIMVAAAAVLFAGFAGLKNTWLSKKSSPGWRQPC